MIKLRLVIAILSVTGLVALSSAQRPEDRHVKREVRRIERKSGDEGRIRRDHRAIDADNARLRNDVRALHGYQATVERDMHNHYNHGNYRADKARYAEAQRRVAQDRAQKGRDERALRDDERRFRH